MFSPGVSFILSTGLTTLPIPPAIGYGIYISIGLLKVKNVPVILQSSSGLILTGTGIWMSWKLLKSWWIRKTHEREARRLRAVPLPVLTGRLPWNIDILRYMLKSTVDNYIGEPFIKWSEQYGHAMNLRLLGDNMMWTSDPSNIKAILATDFTSYAKGPGFQVPMQSVLGTGVFNSDGAMWKFHRSIARPFFSRERISDFDIFTKHADHAILKMKERFKNGQAIDFQDIAGRFTIDSATEFLFGQCVNSLDQPLSTPGSQARSSSITQFAHAFQSAQEVVAYRIRRGTIWPLWEIMGDATKAQMKIINEYINPILEAALEKRSGEVSKLGSDEDKGVEDAEEEEPETFLDHLISVTGDIAVLRDQILNILIAGRDTTAATLTFAVYMLAEHPDTLAKLRHEIMTTVGPTDRPTLEHIRGMKFLRAVINETLRLFPPVPFNIRTCVSNTVWANPETGVRHYIPADSTIMYSVFRMHRRTDLWGEDALEFSPMRWIDERKHYQLNNPFIFLPFQAGPRICLGQQFAYNESSFFLIRLLQNFSHIELAPECQSAPPAAWKGAPGRKGIEKIFPKADLTIYSVGGLWVRMSDEVEADVQGSTLTN